MVPTSKSKTVSQPSARLHSQPWRFVAIGLLALLFATNVYRATTQSVSHDEATFFEWMLTGPWSQVLDFEHGNHHVVSDLLCKLTVSIFGVSEIALRIPALLGGLLYFYSVLRICIFLFGEGPLLLLSVALLSLNPFVLDYLLCARGYGPALGLLFYGLSEFAVHVENPSARTLWLTGVAFGLSIGSNPVMIFPVAAVITSILLTSLAFVRKPSAPVQSPGKDKSRQRRKRDSTQQPSSALMQVILHLAVPAAVIAMILLTLPKRLLDVEPGYTGPASLLAVLRDLIRYSFVHSSVGVRGFGAMLPMETLIGAVTNFVIAFGLVIVIPVTARIVASRNVAQTSPPDKFLFLLAVAIPVNALFIFLSRSVFEMPYPELRTAMYWLPLLSLAALATLGKLRLGDQAERLVAVALTALLGLCVIQFATQFNTRYFAEWAYCAAGKDMIKLIRADHEKTPDKRVNVGATWQLEPVVNFYRVAWKLDWIEPVGRESPNGAHDYYVLGAGDVSLVDSLRLNPLLRDSLSGTVLAKR